MKNLLNPADRQEIISRINQLTPAHQGQWGKMDVAQMITHCQRPIELALKNPKPPRKLLGYILGPMAKKDVFGPTPFKKNGFTPPEFRVADQRDFLRNKEKLLTLIERYPVEMPQVSLLHPFFGAMPLDMWGEGMYKHLYYHLGQFGV